MPSTMPNITAHSILATVNQNVGIKREPISLLTGRLETNELPKSPRATWVIKRTNCSGNGLFRPKSCLTSATTEASAFDPATSLAGSPGSKWTNKNTNTATIISVGIRPNSRLIK
jgi:hypothetical protein